MRRQHALYLVKSSGWEISFRNLAHRSFKIIEKKIVNFRD